MMMMMMYLSFGCYELCFQPPADGGGGGGGLCAGVSGQMLQQMCAGPSGAGSLSCAVFWLQVGVVQYGSTVVHEFSLGEYQTVEEVVEAARSIDQRGGEETRTALGINVARYDTN